MTERDVQLAIYHHRVCIQPMPVIIPNVYFFGWESDALMVTRSLCLHEYEIKRTISDFRADFKKSYRHRCLSTKTGGYPAHLWYVCPPDVIPVDEVPEYAGLAYVVPYKGYYAPVYPDTLSTIKKAPRLSGDKKMPRDRLWELLTKMSSRYWHYQIPELDKEVE